MWKQPSRGVLRKMCSKNMQQIYRKTPIPKCDFNKVEITLQYGCSPINLLHIIYKKTFGGLLLKMDFLWIKVFYKLNTAITSIIITTFTIIIIIIIIFK